MTVAANAAQADYWNGRTGETWAELSRLLDMELGPLGREVQAALKLKAGERVLDIGCGAGETSVELSRAVAPGGSVFGVDISATLLEAARRRAEGLDVEARFEVADAQTSGFGGERFDAAFSRFGVMFFSDPPAAFANILRALKPGGRLGFVCWRPASENPVMTTAVEAVADLIPPLPAPDPTGPGPFAFADAERVRRILGEAGFGQVAIRPFDVRVGGWTPEEALIVCQRVGPLGGVLRENPDLRPRVQETLARALQSHVDPDGKVRMGAAVWIVTATAP